MQIINLLNIGKWTKFVLGLEQEIDQGKENRIKGFRQIRFWKKLFEETPAKLKLYLRMEGEESPRHSSGLDWNSKRSISLLLFKKMLKVSEQKFQ